MGNHYRTHNAVSVLIIILFCSQTWSQQEASSSGPLILIGPNVLASIDDEVPHAETIIAADPANAKNLVGVSIRFTRYDNGTTDAAYTSIDGGYTWHDWNFPERFENCTDPFADFGPQGQAYVTFLCHKINLYKTTDMGETWEKVNALRGADHPQLVVDKTWGRYSGRIYISAMAGNATNPIALYRSEDGGNTFAGPVPVPGPKGDAIFNAKPIVLNDGTLVLPFLAWDGSDLRAKREPPRTYIGFVTSSDGGVTFSEPVRVTDFFPARWIPPKSRDNYFTHSPRVNFGASPNDPKKLYVVWNDNRSKDFRILFCYSHDKGNTWSAPIELTPGLPAPAEQFQPMIDVNREGVIGIAWYDSRESTPGHDRVHLYFAASADDGVTFLTPRRITSAFSQPAGLGNLNLYPADVNAKPNDTGLRFRTNWTRWPDGGDYVGMVADRNGTFHPFWPDSRSGTAQLYTATVQVRRKDVVAQARLAPTTNPQRFESEVDRDDVELDLDQADVVAQARPAPSPKLELALLNGSVALVPDPTRYDPEQNIAEIPLRLKNVSTQPLYGPFTIEVTKINFWSLLSAENGLEGVGARVTYPKSVLGDLDSLPPGGISEPIVWRFKFPGLRHPTISFEIHGYKTATETVPKTR